MFSTKGVNSNQIYHNPGICKEGSVVTLEYQGNDVVCSCGGKEYRRWTGQAKWPARAGVSIYDRKPFAMDQIKVWGFSDAKPAKTSGCSAEPGCVAPQWVYTKSMSNNGGGSVSKTTGQGWNGAGAYSAAACKSGNCKFTAKILKQANTGEPSHLD